MDRAKYNSGVRCETDIKCEGVCGKLFHLALKCLGLDNYTECKLKEINMMEYMWHDYVVYIQIVDGILKKMHKLVDKNNKYLREYKTDHK